MELDQLRVLFAHAGATRLYAKELAENDNSKNQVYFAGAVETLNVFPSKEIYAGPTSKGPSFKARLNFGWLQKDGRVVPAPNAKLILYAQYPEVRFSGFLQGCSKAPGDLFADRARADKFPPELKEQLHGRILFLGVTADRRLIGYTAPGNSTAAHQYRARALPPALVVFKEVPLPEQVDGASVRQVLLSELRRIHKLGWIPAMQRRSANLIESCSGPRCGGLTLEAQLGISLNSKAGPDFMGWEVKQHQVANFDTVDSSAKPITLFTPEPDGGCYTEQGAETFVRRYGYPDTSGRPDRLNFGGRHFYKQRCAKTLLQLNLRGYDVEGQKIIDAKGAITLEDNSGDIAASWSFSKIFEHWSRKHANVVYVPSIKRDEPQLSYRYGNHIRLAEGTNPLALVRAVAAGAVYYDPGIKLSAASSNPEVKRRSQFRVASSQIGQLYSSCRHVVI